MDLIFLFLKKFKIIFFEKEIAHFTFIYLLNLFFISANNQLLDRFLLPTMDAELVELFIYILFIVDLNLKTNRLKASI